MGVGASHLGPSFVGREHPVDAGAASVALGLPSIDFADETLAGFDALVEALALENADLDFDHVEPAGVLWRVMELDLLEQAAGFSRR